MSGNAFTRSTTAKVFGPARRSRLDLMGIRFFFPEPDPDAKGGEGGDNKPDDKKPEDKGGSREYTPPQTQADLDRILNERLARERDKFKDYDDLKKDRQELQKLRDEKLTADEKAIKAAREEGKQEVQAELANERVRFALEKQLAGRVPDAGALLDLDRSQFVKDGKADTDAIRTWVDANSKEATAGKEGNRRDPAQQAGGGSDSSALDSGKSAYERRHPAKKQ